MVEQPVPASSPANRGSDANQGPGTPTGFRYDFERIDLESDSVHANVVKLVGTRKRVLELGPATGYMSRAFQERGCTVVGIELDAAMAEQAAAFCERMIVGDLDTLNLDAELGDERFDAIVAADVLEHLKDPLAVLNRLRPFLSDDGCFVISVPNIAHGSVRLALLSGRFEYREVGLLDETHLRFFTRESLERLLDEAELGLAELHRHDLDIDASEVPFDQQLMTPELHAQLERDPDTRTYQFVAKAFPMAREGLRELQGRLRELAELRPVAVDAAELERKHAERVAEMERRHAERVAEMERRHAELERAMVQVAGREGELRRSLIDAHDQLLRRDAQLERLNQEIERYEEAARNRDVQIERLADEALRLRVRLDRILQSPPGRAYAALKTLPGLRAIQQRRTAGFHSEVAKKTGQGA